MIVLEYPVALVLKGWHMLLTGVLGLDSAQAWLFALFMLVITIRGLLVPVAYRQFRATRISTNLRPKMQALEKSYEERHDAESRREYRQKLKELKKAHNYSMADGCIPAFIQIPAFIGLYRLLLAVLRQIELAPDQRHAIGPLGAEDVSSFLGAQFFGAPLSAFYGMGPGQLAGLGTTKLAVGELVLVMAFIASIFTTLNWAYSLRRTLYTQDHSSNASRLLIRSFMLAGPFIFLSPYLVAFGSFGPVAVMIYWVCNNLWTVTQVFVINRVLDRSHPFTEEFKRFREQSKQDHQDHRRAVREGKRGLRRDKRARRHELAQARRAVSAGSLSAAEFEELRVRLSERSDAQRSELDELLHGEKRRKKELRKARSAQVQAEAAERRKAKKRASAGDGDASEGEGAAETESAPRTERAAEAEGTTGTESATEAESTSEGEGERTSWTEGSSRTERAAETESSSKGED